MRARARSLIVNRPNKAAILLHMREHDDEQKTDYARWWLRLMCETVGVHIMCVSYVRVSSGELRYAPSVIGNGDIP